MRNLTLDPCGWWVAPLFGRSPLLRRSDRIESLVIVLALILALVAAPGGAASAAGVYQAASRAYAEQAHTRHTLTATVTATTVKPYTVTVTARWRAAGNERADSFNWNRTVKSGDQIHIWVNNDGGHVSPPAPTWYAGLDAVGTVVAIWVTVALATTALIVATRLRVDRAREAQWEREIRHLVDDVGQTNGAQ